MAVAVVVRVAQITPTQVMLRAAAVRAVILVAAVQVEITQRVAVAPVVQDQAAAVVVVQELRVITQAAAAESVFWAKVLMVLVVFIAVLMRLAAAAALAVQMGFKVGIRVLPMELLQTAVHTAVAAEVNIQTPPLVTPLVAARQAQLELSGPAIHALSQAHVQETYK
jgi:hypothetical protein